MRWSIMCDIKELNDSNINAVADLKPGYTLGAADVALLQEMARRLLAAETQEPYGYVHKAVYEDGGCCALSNDHEAHHDSQTHIAVYTAPQPVAVPDEMTEHKARMAVGFNRYLAAGYTDEWNACRAAMLNAEPVSQPYKLPQWISCSERMPELDTRVLLYFADYDGHTEDGCIGDEGEGPYHYFFDGDSLRHEPTHW